MTRKEQRAAFEKLVRDETDRAVKPYEGKAPPVVVRKLREIAERWFREHPQAVEILEMQVRNQQLRSGDVVQGALGADADDADAANADDAADAAGKV